MKILASDYDGTFYTDEEQLKRNIEAVKRWRAGGNLFGFVTGRAADMILAPVDQNRIPYDFLVCNNGAAVYGPGRRLLAAAHLPGDRLKEMAEDPALKDTFHLIFIAEDRVCAIRRSEKSWVAEREFMVQIMGVEAMERLERLYQVSLAFGSEKEAAVCADAINRVYGGNLYAHLNKDCIDITASTVNKENGLARFLELSGHEESRLLVVGDGENDVGMISRFSGYAVDNGCSAVKAAAVRVYDSVARLVEEHM